jgi:SAM-dependent methyltransferase
VSDIFDAELPDDHFDGVFVSNFLEHLTDQESVAEFLGRMRRATAPGGRIAVMGPNFRYCPHQYFDMADHTLIFTHRAIAEHLYAAGYEVERIEPRFLPYSFTGRLPPSPTLTRLYLRTPVAWRVLGKQFLCIGRRP